MYLQSVQCSHRKKKSESYSVATCNQELESQEPAELENQKRLAQLFIKEVLEGVEKSEHNNTNIQINFIQHIYSLIVIQKVISGQWSLSLCLHR